MDLETRLEDLRHSARVYTHRLEMESRNDYGDFSKYVNSQMPMAFRSWALKYYWDKISWEDYEKNNLSKEQLDTILINEEYLT